MAYLFSGYRVSILAGSWRTGIGWAVRGAAACLAFLALGQSWAGAPPESLLRLNARPEYVHRPAVPLAYGVASKGSEAFIAWIGRGIVEQRLMGLHAFLSRVDLRSMEIRETLQLSEGMGLTSKGGRILPDVVEYEGEIFVSWMERSQMARRPLHFLKVISLSGFKNGEEAQVFEFGKSMGDPRFVRTSKGLFLLGYSQPIGQTSHLLRLYRFKKDGWHQQDLEKEGIAGREPVLVDSRDGLSLFWVRGFRVFHSSSADGDGWSTPQVLHQGQDRSRFHSLNGVLAGQDQIDLAWVAQRESLSEVWLAQGGKAGWQPAERVLQFNGTDANIVLGHVPRSSHRLISYSLNRTNQPGRLIGVASEMDGWTERLLAPDDPTLTGSRIPHLFQAFDTTYVAWSQYPYRNQRPEGESVFMAAVGGKAADEGKITPVHIGDLDKKRIGMAPRLMEFEGRLFVSFFSVKWMVGMGAISPRGDLFLKPVDLQQLEGR